MSEKLRANGGVFMHLVGESFGAICGYYPALGWAKDEGKDGHRMLCRKCSFIAKQRPGLAAQAAAPGGGA